MTHMRANYALLFTFAQHLKPKNSTMLFKANVTVDLQFWSLKIRMQQQKEAYTTRAEIYRV